MVELARTIDLRNSVVDLSQRSTELNFPKKILQEMVRKWIVARPSMRLVNQDIEFMVRRFIDEVEELKHEQENRGVVFDVLNFEKEAMDALFFLFSLLSNQELLQGIDLPSLVSRYNGIGSKSNVFERMIEVAGNVPDSLNKEKDLELLVAYSLSYWRHSPATHSPEFVMKEVIRKNGSEWSGNYPAVYFSGVDPKTREPLSPDDMQLQFQHARICLRMIREATGNNGNGLKASDHWPYRRYILNFRDAEIAQRELLALLQLPDAVRKQIMDYKSRIHKPDSSYQQIESSNGLVVARQRILH